MLDYSVRFVVWLSGEKCSFSRLTRAHVKKINIKTLYFRSSLVLYAIGHREKIRLDASLVAVSHLVLV